MLNESCGLSFVKITAEENDDVWTRGAKDQTPNSAVSDRPLLSFPYKWAQTNKEFIVSISFASLSASSHSTGSTRTSLPHWL